MVYVDEKDRSVTLKSAGEAEGRKFTYDYVYGVLSTQQQVYDEAAYGLVESVVEGYNGKFELMAISSNTNNRVRAWRGNRDDFCVRPDRLRKESHHDGPARQS